MERKKYKKTSELNKQEKRNVILIAIMIVIAIGVAIYGYMFFKPKVNEDVKVNYSEEKSEKQEIEVKVRDKSKPKRIKVYLGDIVRKINSKKYAEVYERLSPKYKEKNFKNIEDFKKYMNNNWPKNAVVQEKAWQEMADLVVVDVGIVNANNSKDVNNMNRMYFVFKEKGLNEYEFSFSKNW